MLLFIQDFRSEGSPIGRWTAPDSVGRVRPD